MSRSQRAIRKYSRSRSHSYKPTRESFLIFCEGQTEVGYFSSFKKRAKVLPEGNALKLVESALAYIQAALKPTDQYWVVFDKDETSDEQFNQAIELAQANGIHVAWSNQAFECWIILHYRGFSHACHRKDYESLLKQFIPSYNARGKGEDQGRELYRLTAPRLFTALQNARQGHESFVLNLPPAERESSTLVFELVEAILAQN